MDKKWVDAFGKMTYGIYVLTSNAGEAVNGMIASWVSQVSHDPPLILAAVHPNRYTHQLIEKGGCFALHVLSDMQTDFLARFKRPDIEDKFFALDWTTGLTGCPILSDCLAYFECVLKTQYRPGNHTLFIGEVIAVGRLGDGTPLTSLDYEGLYLGKD
ncbi:MAG: flavin reductase family protein [Desulfobacterales bacterium]|jgi:flavin reductase (DIM6/NTAB) family NADH-FMN oxidoreductase RutF